LFVFWTLSGWACSRSSVVGVRFASDADRRAITEIRSFVFGPDANAMVVDCARLDPRGLGPGDAAKRSGLAPETSAKGPIKDTIADLAPLPNGTYTLVIEGFGPGCKRFTAAGMGSAQQCAEVSSQGDPVLRGYYCGVVKLDDSTADTNADLLPIVPLGSVLQIPEGAQKDAMGMSPTFPVIDGLDSRDRFFVQTIDATGVAKNGEPVRWTVTSGQGFFDDVQPATTEHDVVDELTQPDGADGISGVRVHAGTTASSVMQGALTISAYAAGYDGSPVTFHAQALRGIEVSLSSFTLPLEIADLSGADPEFEPIAVDDLDGDGLTDIATFGASSCPAQHQLVVLYGKSGGGFTVASSPPQSQEVTAMKTVRLVRDAPKKLLVFTRDGCNPTFEDRGPHLTMTTCRTTDPHTWVVATPKIELWPSLSTVPADGRIASPPTVISTEDACNDAGCTTVPIGKAVIAADAQDIDGDGVDELVMSRCSWVWKCNSFQDVQISCHGTLNDYTDSEAALYTVDSNASGFSGFKLRATVPNLGHDGGLREVRLADVNGDGSLDLLFATETEVAGVCGSKNQPNTGFGFGSAMMRFHVSATFAQVFSLVAGHFNADNLADAVASAGLRAASTVSGIKMLPGAGCNLDTGPPAVNIGPTTLARLVILRLADLNADGFDDVMVLHREQHQIQTYFGSGSDLLARGPTIDLPGSANGELDLHVENPGMTPTIVAATTAPRDNAVHVVRVTPAARP
jgi:hypothetical protein